MAQLRLSTKRLQVDKANVTIVVVMSIACFITIFSLVASRALIMQRSYQASVIEKKEKARDQLAKNQKARDALVKQYQAFVALPVNIIGGNTSGTGDRDGDNARIVLDALPSKYDFPAVATSLEKLVKLSAMYPKGITGTDNELEQGMADGSVATAPIEVPFELTAEGDNQQLQDLMLVLQRSIRPIKVNKLTVTASEDKLSASIIGVTFYQPEKQLSIKEEIAK